MDGDTKEFAPKKPFLKSRGMKIPKHPQITTGMVRKAITTNAYEYKECEAMMKVVTPDDTVLEIGGGIGYMSALIATKKKVKTIHTYEANPGLIDYIKSVHAANGVEDQITVHNKLLAGRKGKPVKFYIRPNFLASSMDNSVNPEGIIDEVDIEVENINTVLKKLKPTILMCDIEGAEATLLPEADFSCLRAAIIELHPQWIGQDGVQAVFDTMHKAGLTYFPKGSNSKVVTFKKDW